MVLLFNIDKFGVMFVVESICIEVNSLKIIYGVLIVDKYIIISLGVIIIILIISLNLNELISKVDKVFYFVKEEG